MSVFSLRLSVGMIKGPMTRSDSVSDFSVRLSSVMIEGSMTRGNSSVSDFSFLCCPVV